SPPAEPRPRRWRVAGARVLLHARCGWHVPAGDGPGVPGGPGLRPGRRPRLPVPREDGRGRDDHPEPGREPRPERSGPPPFGVSVTDVCTGMWAFNADTLRELSLEARGFDLEADLFGSAALKEARITELPIDYAARIGPPKLIPLRTGLKIALRLFKRRLNGPSTSP